MTGDEKPWHDEEILAELYQARGMTTREIAGELGCSNGTVSRKLNDFGIETRNNWSEGVKAAAEANRVEYAKNRTLESGYEYWSDRVDGVMRIVYVHRLMAVAEYGFDAVANNDVHHGVESHLPKCEIPWANWPGNIELMGKSEHGKMHSEEYWQSQKADG